MKLKILNFKSQALKTVHVSIKSVDDINLKRQPPNSAGSLSEGDVLDEHVEMYSNSYH